ncbi:hypothetical protein DIURU_001950 [Diutina rugosa]|uniref:Securin n=1 Tax=Diutina rugosa TaxID=5481 RepID=A0A642USC7_DIURU|nr:uncharacterized protein DIURU_001950 [Diutina rugosa]KAA8904369.1 hypothetical protein DIURU_001950 [Diutina rugosa]
MNQENAGAPARPTNGSTKSKRLALNAKDPNQIRSSLLRAKSTLTEGAPESKSLSSRLPLNNLEGTTVRAPPILTKANSTLGFIHKPDISVRKSVTKRSLKLRKLKHDYIGAVKAYRGRELVPENSVSDDLVKRLFPPKSPVGPLEHTERTKQLHSSNIQTSKENHGDPIKRNVMMESRDMDQPVEFIPTETPPQYIPEGLEPLTPHDINRLGAIQSDLTFDEPESPCPQVGLTHNELNDLLE